MREGSGGGNDGVGGTADDIFGRVEFGLVLLAAMFDVRGCRAHQVEAEQQRAEGRGEEDVDEVGSQIAEPGSGVHCWEGSDEGCCM